MTGEGEAVARAVVADGDGDGDEDVGLDGGAADRESARGGRVIRACLTHAAEQSARSVAKRREGTGEARPGV